ncbi:glycosyltransferase family 4 protein [Geodermatophilus sp. SYSU D00525]
MRALFVNENLGGHATVHANLKRSLVAFPEVHADFVDVPPPTFLRRVMGVRVPGLARADLDFQSLRFQLAASAAARPLVRRALSGHDVLHVYSHTISWLFPGLLRSMPSVLATDATNEQNLELRPYRRTSVGTGVSSRPIEALERRVLTAATVVVAQSEWAARSLRELGVTEQRLRLVRYGVPVPGEIPTRTSTDLPEIVFVGKTLERKGGNLLRDVFRTRLRGKARLVLVTQEPVPDEDGIVVHRDIRPGDGQLDRILQRAAVFALPTDTDMSPNAILEAMSAGLPVVSTQHAAIPELVVHGETGLLVEPRDGRALGDALLDLLEHPDRARLMGERGYERARDVFDVGKTTRDVVEVLGLAQDLWQEDRRHGRS